MQRREMMHSGMSTGHRTVWVDVLDGDGYEIGRTVPVEVTYVIETDADYGADADGRRGVLSRQVVALDTYVDQGILRTLNSYQVEQVLATAKSMIENGPI